MIQLHDKKKTSKNGKKLSIKQSFYKIATEITFPVGEHGLVSGKLFVTPASKKWRESIMIYQKAVFEVQLHNKAENRCKPLYEV